MSKKKGKKGQESKKKYTNLDKIMFRTIERMISNKQIVPRENAEVSLRFIEDKDREALITALKIGNPSTIDRAALRFGNAGLAVCWNKASVSFAYHTFPFMVDDEGLAFLSYHRGKGIRVHLVSQIK